MTTSEVLDGWYKALFREDCVEVMRLLKKEPSLLMEGSKEGSSRDYVGRPVNGPDPNPWPWEGRTALQVGARKGCVDLIKQVLLLCNLEAVRNYGMVDEQGTGATESRGDIVATRDQSYPAESTGVERNGQNIAGDDSVSESVEENGPERADAGQKTGSGHGRPRRTLKTAVSTIIGSNCLGQGKRKKTAYDVPAVQPFVDPLEQKVLKEEEIMLEDTRDDSDSIKHSSDAEARKNHGTNLGYSVTRKDLRELLLFKGCYGSEALAIAVIHYNRDVIDLLMYALGECDNPPYKIRKSTLSRRDVHDKNTAWGLDKVRLATAKVISSLDDDIGSECLLQFSKHTDFNFLPREEYFFHFLCTDRTWIETQMALWKEVRSLEGSVWRFLLELKDGQGRTPFHAALDSSGAPDEFVKLFTDGDDEMLICALTALDAAGRNPLYRAAASSRVANIDVILRYFGKYEKIRAMWHARPQHPLQYYYTGAARSVGDDTSRALSLLGKEYGLGPNTATFSPLHVAIILKSYQCARHMIEKAVDIGWSEREIFYVTEYSRVVDGRPPKQLKTIKADAVTWGLIGIACLLKADMEFMDYLFKREYLPESKRILKGDDWGCSNYKMQKDPLQFAPDMEDIKQQPRLDSKLSPEDILEDPWQTLHVVASLGKYKMLRLCLDDPQCDPFTEDFEGNNALHYAMNVREFSEYDASLLHFVHWLSLSCELFIKKKILEDVEKEDKKVVEERRIVEREGCVNLLLQAGCDVFTYNKKKQVPYPQGNLIDDAKFCSWWNNKQEKEFAAIQNKLNIASNAISVTAALVATASYVGPLQPPLGYAGDPVNQIQYENVFVAVFVFCDTMSFYLAIVAIILALTPSLPMWQQPIVEELRRTQTMVTLAVSALLPSIVCVLIAFASSSMAVVSARLLSSIGGKLTIATLCIGAPLILGAFFLFFVRLLGFLFPGYSWARYVYKRCTG